jgi:hypothetical protein
MNQSGDQGDAVASKIEGLRAFTRAGYRPVAFVDHEPSVLHGVFEADETRDILFLRRGRRLDRRVSPDPVRPPVDTST